LLIAASGYRRRCEGGRIDGTTPGDCERTRVNGISIILAARIKNYVSATVVEMIYALILVDAIPKMPVTPVINRHNLRGVVNFLDRCINRLWFLIV
jgi:hypothetical protein